MSLTWTNRLGMLAIVLWSNFPISDSLGQANTDFCQNGAASQFVLNLCAADEAYALDQEYSSVLLQLMAKQVPQEREVLFQEHLRWLAARE